MRRKRSKATEASARKLDAEVALRAREAGPEEEAEAGLLQAAGTVLTTGVTTPCRGGRPASRSSTLRQARPAKCRLDPALGPRQNAAALFARARKIRRRAVLAAQKLPGLAARRLRLEEELALAGAPAAAVAPGIPPGVPREAPAAATKAMPGIREYRSGEGWRILVGKSSAGNDQHTGRLAAPDDYWFHVRDYPGAHVVLKGAGADPPGEAIAAAGSTPT